ncbi:PAS domain-containing protein [Desulfopila sp. IMCC35008]|uniref:PAS domain-containing protein n=1 Tax=Desulfopila sp. IMCC35008 TaxID=2653858 RepID=UPI0013D1C052|nr:PAS domain-containing protein [Desulfopila sp. IMCC35008]
MEETEKLAGVGGWAWDIDTDVWTFSDNWLRIHGCSGGHLKSADLLPIAHPDDRSDIELAFDRAVTEGSNYEIEHRILRQDTGEERYIRSFGKPRLDSDGKVVKLLGSAQDITKQKKVEETLRESEGKFRHLFDHSPIGKTITYISGEMQANNALAQMLGYSQDEFRNFKWQDITHPGDLELSQNTMDSVISDEKHFVRFTKRYIHKNGSIVWGDVNTRLQRDSNGVPLYFITAVVDITEQKRIEEELAVSEQKFRTLAENVPGLVLKYKLDPNGNDELLYISKSVEDIFEVSQEDAYNNNKLLWDRIHRDDLEGYMKSIRTSAENLSLWQQEHRIQLPGDRVKWLYIRGFPFQQDDGAVIWNTIALDITEQKKTQALLEEKDKALRLSLDAAKAGTWTWDVKTDEVVWDEQMQKIFGLEPGTFTGTFDAWKERVHPDDLQEAENVTLKALERGKRYEHEYRVKGFSGDWRIINAQAATLEDKNGEPIRMSGFATDITDRKEMEEALKRSQQRFELAMTASRDGIYDWDLVTNKIYYSPGWKSMLGYGNDELPNDFSVWEKLTEPVDVKRSWEMQQELINKVRDRFEMEFRMKHKDGHWVDILSRATAIFDHNGKAVRIVGTHVDVTERRQIKEKSNRLKERLESLWNITKISDSDTKTISDHVLVEVQKMTQSQYAFYGFLNENENDMILHAWSQETMEDCRTKANTIHFSIDRAGIWAEAVKEKKILTINDLSSDLPGKKGVPGGHVQLTRLMVVPYIKEDKVISVVAVANKETEYLKDDEEQVLAFMRNVQLLIDRKTAQQEAAEMATHLQQAQKMEAIGTLAGGIAHDFNNILGSILGYAEMVQEDCPPGSTMRRDMDRVVEASLRAKELVRQILAFSHQTETEEVPLQPALIIKEAVKMLRSSLPTTIDLQQDIDPEAGLTLADPTQIHQILTNLCTNAFHAMEKTGGTLNISLKNKSFTLSELVHAPHVQPGTFVEISVRDTGPGIKPEIMDKIFDPFFTTKEIGKGTGMGLAIIHGIAKKSGGFISCKSSPSEGTTFYVYLPIYAGMTPPVAEMAPLELIKPGNERILFIDDEEMLAEMGKTMLERLGYKVTVETSSIQALRILQNQPDRFDLIITDQTMPGMTGSDLARRILQLRPKLPIILCTGFSNQISEEKAKIYGIKGFAMKPLAKKDLADLIRKVLDEET